LTKLEAWLWMLMEARHVKTKEFVKERLIETPRGSFTHSLRYLADAWKWSKTRVETFLKHLENEKMIVRKSRQGIGQITILNYDTYQIRRDTDKDSQRTLKGQSKDTERTELNNDKELNQAGKKKNRYGQNSIEFRLAEYTIEKINLNHSHIRFTPSRMEKCCDMFRLLITKDGFEPELIMRVVDWVTGQTIQNSKGFCWSDQFRSPLTQRKENDEGIKYIDVWISEMNRNQKPRQLTSDDDPDCQEWKDKHRRVVNA
jgi:hypothetical protein